MKHHDEYIVHRAMAQYEADTYEPTPFARGYVEHELRKSIDLLIRAGIDIIDVPAVDDYPQIWRTKEGERLRVADMETSHLANSLRLLYRHPLGLVKMRHSELIAFEDYASDRDWFGGSDIEAYLTFSRLEMGVTGYDDNGKPVRDREAWRLQLLAFVESDHLVRAMQLELGRRISLGESTFETIPPPIAKPRPRSTPT